MPDTAKSTFGGRGNKNTMFRAFAFVSLLFAVGCVAPAYLIEPTMVVVRGRPPAPPEPAPAPPPRLERIVVTDTIEFETNLDVLRSESKQVLDGVATTIKQHPELIKIRVEVHTDSEGKSADNMVLSRKRAIAVRAYLIGRGEIGRAHV